MVQRLAIISLILFSLSGCAYNEVYITASDNSKVESVTISTDRPVQVRTEAQVPAGALVK